MVCTLLRCVADVKFRFADNYILFLDFAQHHKIVKFELYIVVNWDPAGVVCQWAETTALKSELSQEITPWFEPCPSRWVRAMWRTKDKASFADLLTLETSCFHFTSQCDIIMGGDRSASWVSNSSNAFLNVPGKCKIVCTSPVDVF